MPLQPMNEPRKKQLIFDKRHKLVKALKAMEKAENDAKRAAEEAAQRRKIAHE